jgi:hypothetical protein
MGFKSATKSLFKSLGFTLIKGDLVAKVKNVEAPSLSEHHLPNCKVYANRQLVLKDLPKNGVVVEVGVAYGDFSEIIINELKPQHFVAIDFFETINKDEEPWGKNELSKTNLTHEEYYQKRFGNQASIEIKKGYSWDKLAEFPDDHFDYIYLDAGHLYHDVKKDIEALKPKLKVGGFVQFNDYTIIAPSLLEPYGVPRAVNELLLEGGYEMTALCLQSGGYHDVVLKKIS